jgi:hypothetical protein
MSSRLRQRRNKSIAVPSRPVPSRTAAVYRPPLSGAAPAVGAPVDHGLRPRTDIEWRWISGMIVVLLSGVLTLFFTLDAFYVRAVAVGGLTYLTKDEVFSLASVVNEEGSIHLFWLDPNDIRTSLLRSPSIADATVYVGWPPDMVQIIIQEREPSLVWVQSGVAVWLDLQGRVMRQRIDRPDLVRVIAEGDDLGVPNVNVPIDQEIVNGALQLHTLVPEQTTLRYDRIKGLGYNDPNGWVVWYGIGSNMAEKHLIYTTIINNLRARGIAPLEINVSNPDAPFYSTNWGM